MQKHFHELIKINEFDLNREYIKLHRMFYSKEIWIDNPYPGKITIYNELDRNFEKVKFNDSFDSLWEFDNKNKIVFRTSENSSDLDFYLLFCEYILTLLENYDFLEKELQDYSKKIIDAIEKAIDKINYMTTKKEGFPIIIPKDETLIEVTQKLEPSLKEKVLSYRHHSLTGKIDEKRDILNRLALDLEPQRNLLSSLASNFTSDLFAAFNKFTIRHNNSDPSDNVKYNEKFTKLSDKEKEEIYDYVFQYCLIALKLLDNKKCKCLIDTYKQ